MTKGILHGFMNVDLTVNWMRGNGTGRERGQARRRIEPDWKPRDLL